MVRFHARTDVGLKRQKNEDALLALEDIGLFVVADGVGGRMAGELASAMTIDTFHGYAPRFSDALDAFEDGRTSQARDEVLALLEEAAGEASARVFETASLTGREGMTSTLVAALVRAGTAFIIHVGDSRAYLLRKGELQQLTRDHSYINELLATGAMRPEEVAQSRLKNVITRAIGLYTSVQADTMAVELQPGDRILLCSDGLSDLVPPEMMARQLGGADLREAVEQLVESALQAGGKDNITVVALQAGISPDDALMPDRSRVLESLFLFEGLPFHALQRVSRIVHDQIVESGEIICQQGHHESHMFVVVTGQFSVERDGREIARLGSGDHFGELALISPGPRTATVKALLPGHLLTIDREALQAWCALEPNVGNRVLWKLLDVLARRFRRQSQS